MSSIDGFKYVSIHDPKWQVEAIQWDQDSRDLAATYPRWFIDLLCKTHHTGDTIELNVVLKEWFLRHSDRADEILKEGDWIMLTPYRQFIVFSAVSFETQMRRFDEEQDSNDGN